MIITPIHLSDRSSLLHLALKTGLFTASEAEALLGSILHQLSAGTLPEGHTALACRPQPEVPPIGWTYFAPDPHADGVWNVWWLGVSPEAHGNGAGRALLRAAEAQGLAAGARIIVIETSSTDPLARARRFYAKEGYVECGRVPDFYGFGDHKVILSRRPRPPEPEPVAEAGSA